MSSVPGFSVALCTCDGGAFLGELLMSLARQSVKPVELVVCDDASNDDTLAQIENFARNAPFPVLVTENRCRLGIRRNFEQAISRCSAEIVAVCDQDDVWAPDKLERYRVHFETGATWVYADAEVVDSDLRPLGYTLWDRVGFGKDERELSQRGDVFSVLLKRYVVAGATLAFRADHLSQLLPIPDTWLYDAWLAIMLASLGQGALIDRPVQYYRQHGSNVIGARKRNYISQIRDGLSVDRSRYYKEEVARWCDLERRLSASHAACSYQKKIEAKLAHLRLRASLPDNRLSRIPKVVAEWWRGGYARYSRNWGSIALDLLIR